MITWSTETLCVDADLTALESNALRWCQSRGSASYRQSAKDQIEARLRAHFRALALQITGSEVLDLISDVEPLRHVSAFLTLHLICNDCSSGGDLFADKASMYYAKYNERWPDALSLLSVDTDESGAIDYAERFNVRTDVRFTR